MRLRTVLAVSALFAVAAPPQDPTRAAIPSATAEISGTVVTDEETPVPLRRARVTLATTDGRNGTTVITDDLGRFIAQSLPPGRYTVSAFRAGFVRSVLGARQPGGSGVPVVVAEGERSSGHVIRVPRGAVITGVLRDGSGRPLPGVAIVLSRSGYKDGTRVRVPDPGTSVTDDQGGYRIYGLRPGEYFVSTAARRFSDDVPIVPTRPEDVARARALLSLPGRSVPQPVKGSAPLGQVMTYYPGVTSPEEAVAIRLQKAEERRGVDFAVTLQPIASFTATVVMPDGQLATMAFRAIARREGNSVSQGDDAVMIVERPPRLTLSRLLPGAYTLSVEAPEPGTTRPMAYWAQATVHVADQDVEGVILQLSPSMTVSGRLVYENMTETDRPKTEVPITLTEALVTRHITAPNGKSNADGTFLIAGVSPRRYQVDVRPGQGWFVKSIRRSTARSEDIDYADVPLLIEPGVSPADLVVTLTRNSTRLSGVLSDDQGRAATDFHIVVFSVDRRYWTPRSRRIRAVRPATDGAFSLSGLPEGDYLIAALTDLEEGEWFDRTFLDSIAGVAIKVKVSEETPAVQAIRIAR